MAWTLTAATANAVRDVMLALINANSAPSVILGTAGMALPSTGILAVFPVFAITLGTGSLELFGSSGQTATATGTGTAAEAIICDSTSTSGNEIYRVSVTLTAGSGPFTLSRLSVTSGDVLALAFRGTIWKIT